MTPALKRLAAIAEAGEAALADDADFAEAVRTVEALLFASPDPMSVDELADRMPAGADVGSALTELERIYAPRGVHLVRVAGRFAFRTAPDLAVRLSREVPVVHKLSRAAMEVLAIVAYHQPVTRAEIEEIRGVTTSKGTLDLLLETGWVRLRGRRRAPGRPVTYGSTPGFLSHFGLEAVSDLPGLDELKGLGFLDERLPPGLGGPTPSDDPALAEDEEPLEPDLLSITPYDEQD